MIGLQHYLILSAVLLCIGLYGALAKRNAVTILMALELMFNAVNVAAVGFSKYVTPLALARNPQSAADQAVGALLTGQVFAIFVITVAAAEVALGLALVIAIYRTRETVDITHADLMKH